MPSSRSGNRPPLSKQVLRYQQAMDRLEHLLQRSHQRGRPWPHESTDDELWSLRNSTDALWFNAVNVPIGELRLMAGGDNFDPKRLFPHIPKKYRVPMEVKDHSHFTKWTSETRFTGFEQALQCLICSVSAYPYLKSYIARKHHVHLMKAVLAKAAASLQERGDDE